VRGVENIPLTGVLRAMNHLSDADSILVFGFTPRP
jgi:1-acyl-sn-glycerol-3-phosphate acyltransferase